MDPRIRIFLRKTRYLWLGLAAAGVLCLAAFLLLNLSLKDAHGPFQSIQSAYQLDVPLDRNELERLDLQAENVRLEVAMASNINKIKVRLYGDGYTDQSAKVDIDGATCSIALNGTTGHAPLTMRVLVPQNALKTLTVNGQNLELDVQRMRAKVVDIAQAQGHLTLGEIKADRVSVLSVDAAMRVENSNISALRIATEQSPLTLRENKVRLAEVVNQKGEVFLFDTTLRGQWNILTQDGDVTAMTRRLPYNVAIDVASDKGTVDVGYRSRYWERTLVAEDNDRRYVGSVGISPASTLSVYTDNGDIRILQRERYSNTDPLLQE